MTFSKAADLLLHYTRTGTEAWGDHGWRARLGLISPSAKKGTLLQLEYEKLIPVGVEMLVEVEPFGAELTEEALTAATRNLAEKSRILKDRGVDALLYGCTTGSLIKGVGYDKKLVEIMEKASGKLPSATMIGSVVEAIKALSVKNIVVVTPYPESITQVEVRFLVDSGIDVVSHKSAFPEDKPPTVREYAIVPPGFWYRLAKEEFYRAKAKGERLNGVFLSCGAIRTIDIIDILERDLGVPCVSSIQASMWKVLRMANVNEKIQGYGRLLREF